MFARALFSAWSGLVAHSLLLQQEPEEFLKWTSIDCTSDGVADELKQRLENFEEKSYSVVPAALSTVGDQAKVTATLAYVKKFQAFLATCSVSDHDFFLSRSGAINTIILAALKHKENVAAGIDPTGFAYGVEYHYLDLPPASTPPRVMADWSVGKVASLDAKVHKAISEHVFEEMLRWTPKMSTVLKGAAEQIDRTAEQLHAPSDEVDSSQAVIAVLQAHVVELLKELRAAATAAGVPTNPRAGAAAALVQRH